MEPASAVPRRRGLLGALMSLAGSSQAEEMSSVSELTQYADARSALAIWLPSLVPIAFNVGSSKEQLADLPMEAMLALAGQLQALSTPAQGLCQLSASIGQLRALKSLSLSKNQLTQLPATISSLSNLENLDLSFNALAVIPGSIGCLKKLRCAAEKNLRWLSLCAHF